MRRNGDGFSGKAEYSHGLGAHRRIIARGVLIVGTTSDFLGQYNRNSYGSTVFRYGF